MDSLGHGSNLTCKLCVCTATIPIPAPLSCSSSPWLPAVLGTLLPSSVDAKLPAGTFLLLTAVARHLLNTSLTSAPAAFHTCSPPQRPAEEGHLAACSYCGVLPSAKEKTRHELVFVCCKKRHLRTAVKHNLPAKIRLKPPIKMPCLSSGTTENCSPCFCLKGNAVITPLLQTPTNIY